MIQPVSQSADSNEIGMIIDYNTKKNEEFANHLENTKRFEF